MMGLLVVAMAMPKQGLGYEVVPVADGGTIRGQVKWPGEPPTPEKVEITKDEDTCGKTEKVNESLLVRADNGLQNVVVSIESIERGKRQRRGRALLDQKDCRYVPHVVLVPVGVSLTLKNSDGILHNVHSHSVENPPFNKPQPKFKKTMQTTFSKAETIKVTCDAHTWMSGWIIVHEHPYYAVTDESGRFVLSDVPPGKYTLRIWHETLGESRHSVSVPPRSEVPIHLELSR
jgi:plastocyanin